MKYNIHKDWGISVSFHQEAKSLLAGEKLADTRQETKAKKGRPSLKKASTMAQAVDEGKKIQCDAVITRSLFSQIFTKDSSPIRAKYGVSFVDSASDWYSASVPLIIHVMSYNTGPCFNGFWLYISKLGQHQDANAVGSFH